MARYCDEQALVCGELEGNASELGKELTNRVAAEGGDCCIPKKKESGSHSAVML